MNTKHHKLVMLMFSSYISETKTTYKESAVTIKIKKSFLCSIIY